MFDNLRKQATRWLYRKLQPFMEYVQNDLRWEIQKALRAEAIQDGLTRWRRFRENFTLGEYIRLTARPSEDICSHRKGAGPYVSPEKEAAQSKRIGSDYNVSGFRYIDGTERIRCNRCGKRWFAGDPGWKDAVIMLEGSTNGWASSEVPYYRGSKYTDPRMEKIQEAKNAVDKKEGL